VLDRTELSAFQQMVQARVAGSDYKDVFVFIHGFNSAFEDAVFRAAEVWHFLGRVRVPLVYTWPAGHGGLRGYAYDRESGEFTVSASPRDRAIELADLIFASRGRLGTFAPRDFSPRARQALAQVPNLHFVDCKVTHFSNTHDYVFTHPAALSDLILVLRTRSDP